MAVTATPIFVQAANVTVIQFTSADTTVAKTVFTADATNPSVLRAINVVNDDTAVIDFDVLIDLGGSDFYLGTVQCAAGAGRTADSNGTNVLDPVAIPGLNDDGELFLPPAAEIKLACKATMTAAKIADVTAVGADY
jgi:hypothetical protein